MNVPENFKEGRRRKNGGALSKRHDHDSSSAAPGVTANVWIRLADLTSPMIWVWEVLERRPLRLVTFQILVRPSRALRSCDRIERLASRIRSRGGPSARARRRLFSTADACGVIGVSMVHLMSITPTPRAILVDVQAHRIGLRAMGEFEYEVIGVLRWKS